MSIVKETVKKMLPSRIKEILVLFLQQQEQAKRAAQIFEKNRRKIDALLKRSDPIKLEFGAGENRGIAGWTYADLNEECDLTLDLTQPLPFPDNCVSVIYSSHLLEHFEYADLVKFLKECLRILKPGGVFSAAVPNARIYLEAYQNSVGFDPSLFCRYEPSYNGNSRMDYVNYIAYMGSHHRYMFDEDNLLALLEKFDFKNIRLRKFDEQLDILTRDFQSIYVLGEK